MSEIRVYDFSKENREFAPHLAECDDCEKENRTVEGYAIVFGQRSRVLYDSKAKKAFTEVIEPRALSKEFLDNMDIKLLFNHDSNFLLGRSAFGEGTLEYEIDEYGVRYKCELPRTTDGNNVLELIKRGDIFGCSFAFTYDKDGVIDEKKNGENLRTIIKFDSISDFSIVVDPAYWGTVVCARAFEEPAPAPVIEEEEKREAFNAALELELMEISNL